jgi:hypothetical protein
MLEWPGTKTRNARRSAARGLDVVKGVSESSSLKATEANIYQVASHESTNTERQSKKHINFPLALHIMSYS